MNKFLSFLGLAKRSGSIIEGYSKCNEQRNKKKIYLFIISNDASEASKKKFKNHCIDNNIKYIQNFSKEELGAAVGRPEIKIIAILDNNIAKKLVALYQEEEKYELK